ncbi:unnamed protein product [Spirodela intermedia]|uniref:Cytochrome c-553 n=1 Tax=Spirodela intermedia TaxID=51605 RepID=A0A7I8JJX4_SPIIN|nr:unnamed protein product [Spirodela intermedia]CAA6669893.1 unnamed protein product [Spirodela intermedia]
MLIFLVVDILQMFDTKLFCHEVNAAYNVGSQTRAQPWRVQQRPGDEEGPGVLLRLLAPPLAATILTLSPPYFLTTPASPNGGAALFRRACIGCHDAGGNILQPEWRRHREEIYKITYFGKGRMPGFGEKCTPRGQCTFGPRLQEEEIKQLAEFVKLQATKGWPKIEVNGEEQ